MSQSRKRNHNRLFTSVCCVLPVYVQLCRFDQAEYVTSITSSILIHYLRGVLGLVG